MILEIYDIEVLTNCFTYTGYVPSENKYYQFVIWKHRNDYIDCVKKYMEERENESVEKVPYSLRQV